MNVTRAPFGHTPDGKAVDLFTLTSAKGIEVRVISYGGTIVSLRIPDREGRREDVVLGHDDLEGHLNAARYFGSLIGRYANRIAKGRFTLDGITHTLATNNGPNHLHGGHRGFDKVVWTGEPFQSREGAGVVLSYTSPHGEEGDSQRQTDQQTGQPQPSSHVCVTSRRDSPHCPAPLTPLYRAVYPPSTMRAEPVM